MSKKTQTKKSVAKQSGPAKSASAKAKSTKSKKAGSGPMDVTLLEQITLLMKEADLNTVDVRDGERRIVLKRGAVAAQVFAGPSQPVQQSYAPPAPAPAATSSSAPAKPAADTDAGLIPIKSPMVGTFYASSSPEAKPFVAVGSTVDDETDVCIIEAMKVFNNIKAETKGTIAKVLVTNGQTVEFGQPLFLVKP